MGEEERLQALKEEARIWGREGGLPVENEDFNFILTQGGEVTEENTLSVDNCYIHRATLIDKETEYRFKTVTQEKFHFEPPF